MSIVGALILVVGPVRLSGQWADRCQGRFGWTDTELIITFVLGGVAFLVGYDYENDRVHLGQLLGGVVSAGAVVMFLMLVGRGCGD